MAYQIKAKDRDYLERSVRVVSECDELGFEAEARNIRACLEYDFDVLAKSNPALCRNIVTNLLKFTGFSMTTLAMLERVLKKLNSKDNK